MPNNRKFVVATAFVALATAGVAFTLHGYHNYLYDLAPEIDRKVHRKAFRQMMKRILKQEINVDGLDEEAMEALYLQEVAEVLAT